MKPRRSGTRFPGDLADVDENVVLSLSDVIDKYETLYRYAPALGEEHFAREIVKHDAMLAKSLQNVSKDQLMSAIIRLLKNTVKDAEHHKQRNVWTGEKKTVIKYVGDINAFDSADIISKILLAPDRQLVVSSLAGLLNLKNGDILIDELERRIGSVEEEDMILDARNLYADSKPQMNAARLFSEKNKEQAARKQTSAKKQEQDKFVPPSLGDSLGKK